MQRRYSALAFLLLTACAGDNPTGLVRTSDARFAGARVSPQLPLKGWTQGTVAFGPACGVPATSNFRIQGTGELSHMGAVSVVITGCLSLMSGQPVGTPTGVVVAANGDSTFMDITSMTINLRTGTTVATYTFTGGSGRFSSIQGEMATDGVSVTDVPGINWKNTITGWIRY